MKESNSKEKHFENITMNEILVAFSQKYHGHFFKILEATISTTRFVRVPTSSFSKISENIARMACFHD